MNELDKELINRITEAAKEGDLKEVKRLRSYQKWLDSRLLVVCSAPPFSIHDNVDGATYFIRKGANVNIQDKKGKTPLMWSVHWNKYKLTELLLKSDADIDIIDNEGRTALMHESYISEAAQLVFTARVLRESKINSFYILDPLTHKDNIILAEFKRWFIISPMDVANSDINWLCYGLEEACNELFFLPSVHIICFPELGMLQIFSNKKWHRSYAFSYQFEFITKKSKIITKIIANDIDFSEKEPNHYKCYLTIYYMEQRNESVR